MTSRARRPTNPFDGIAGPVRAALDQAGIRTLEQVSRTTSKELLALHGIGPKGIRQLREAMASSGLRFADE